ncbi:unnamed protein product [Caenorhabditis auriculariae]|uniref:G protein-coupled receptor n=1 Tax=Caenorhabditis auriculariae TaxID=2777116 RepID=A0A8S1HVN6_9PELO|nr:unnamed protein product [Caenorhabditis auriculariae]
MPFCHKLGRFGYQYLCTEKTNLRVASCVFIGFKYKSWHLNTNTLYLIYIAEWFEFLIGWILITPYKEGWIPVSELPTVYLPDFQTYAITVDALQHAPLIIGAFLRMRYMLLICSALPAAVLERSFATKYVRDYEYKTRPFVWIGIFLLFQIIATFFAILGILGFLFLYLVHYNKRLNRLLNSHNYEHNMYSLALKYQVEENVRILEAIHRMIFLVWTTTAMSALTLTIASFGTMPEHVLIRLLLLIEFLMNLNPLAIVPCGIWITPRWRQVYSEVLPNLLRKRFCRQPSKVHVIERCMSIQQQTDFYFKNLEKAW